MRNISVSDRSVVLFFCLLSLLLTSIWFRSGNLFLGAEESVPFYNLDLIFQIYSSTWLEQFLGVAYLIDIAKMPFFGGLAMLQNIGINQFFLQVGTFFLFLFGGSISCFFLFKLLFKELPTKHLIAFFGALFYLLNPYSVGDIWSRGIYNQFFAYLYYPLFLWLFIVYLEKNRFLYLVLGLVSSFILSSAMGNPSYTISLWVLMGSYWLFYLLEHLTNISLLKRLGMGILVYFLGWIIINSWWLGVFVLYAPGAYLTEGSGFQNALESFRAVSGQTPFINTIRLFHAIRFGPDFYGTIYDNWILIGLSFIVPLILVFSVRWYKHSGFKFLAGLFAIGLVVCLGANPPFGFIFTYLFEHIQLIQVFRNPYEKFGLIYLLAYSGLFGLGMLSILRLIFKVVKSLKIAGLTVVVTIILLNGIYVWPLWNGAVIEWGTQAEVPTKYSEIDTWLNKHNDTESLALFLPFLPSLGAFYKWGGDYHGNDPIYQMMHTSVLTQEGTIPYLKAIKMEIGNQDITGALRLLRVKYLINRPEVVVPEDNRDDLDQILLRQQQPDFKKVTVISDTPIYQLEGLSLPEIGSLVNVKEVENFEILFSEAQKNDLTRTQFVLATHNINPYITKRDYLSVVNHFMKYDPMRYLVEFDTGVPKLFYLAKTFHPQWRVVILDNRSEIEDTFLNNIKLLFKPFISEKEHFVLNGYANGWITQDTNKVYGVLYMPQVLMKVLWIVSLTVFGICLTIILLLIIKGFYEKK